MSKHTRDNGDDGERAKKRQRVDEPECNILCVPFEILQLVASHLRSSQLHALRFTCKRFRSAVSSYALQQGITFNRGTIQDAVAGSLSLVKWAHDTGFVLDVARFLFFLVPNEICSVFKEAVKSKNLEIVQWTVETGALDMSLHKHSSIVAQFGNVEIAKYLFEKNLQVMAHFGYIALRSRNFEVFQWARANFTSTADIGTAMASGNLEIVKMIYKDDLKIRSRARDKEILGPIITLNNLVVATKAGNLEVLDYVISNCNCAELNTVVMAAAAFKGDLKLIAWLREKGCEWDERACEKAAKSGNIEMLKYLRENGCPWDEKTFIAAVMSNNDKITIWALEHGCPFGEYLGNLLAFCGIEVLNWAEKRNFDFSSVSIMSIISRGRMEVILWFDERGLISKDNYLYVVESCLGDIYMENTEKFDVSKWIDDSTASQALKHAIINGKVNVAKRILSEFRSAICTVDSSDCEELLLEGDLEFLKVLKEKNIILGRKEPDDAQFYFFAYSQQPVLQWLFEIGIPFPLPSSHLLNIMVENQLNSSIKWAIENGCIPNAETFYYSVSTENYDLVEYLVAKKCKFNPNRVMTVAAEGCSPVFLKFLNSLNKFNMLQSATVAAAKNLNFSALKWLVENGCSWNPKKCYTHAKNRSFVICEWIEQKVGGINNIFKKKVKSKKDVEVEDNEEGEGEYEKTTKKKVKKSEMDEDEESDLEVKTKRNKREGKTKKTKKKAARKKIRRNTRKAQQ